MEVVPHINEVCETTPGAKDSSTSAVGSLKRVKESSSSCFGFHILVRLTTALESHASGFLCHLLKMLLNLKAIVTEKIRFTFEAGETLAMKMVVAQRTLVSYSSLCNNFYFVVYLTLDDQLLSTKSFGNKKDEAGQ